MKETYYEEIKNFIEKQKKSLIILSPTFSIYNYSKIKGKNNFNKELADVTKKFFIMLALYNFILIGIYDVYRMIKINQKNYILIAIFSAISIAIPYFFIKKVISKDYKINLIQKKGNTLQSKIRIFIITKIFNQKIINIFDLITIIFLSIVLIAIMFPDTVLVNDIFQRFNIITKGILFFIVIYIYAVSRPIHFFLVFIRDIIKKTYKKDERDTDGKIRLIILSIGSYINLMLDYTILFYTFNTIGIELLGMQMFDCKVNNVLDMLYYTSGFGEINPVNFMTKTLVMIKEVSIFTLITGNFAIYLAIDSKKNNHQKINNGN